MVMPIHLTRLFSENLHVTHDPDCTQLKSDLNLELTQSDLDLPDRFVHVVAGVARESVVQVANEEVTILVSE